MNADRSYCKRAVALVIALVSGCALIWPAESCAQQANIATPFNSVGHGFYENIGTRWGVSGPGWIFNFGGPPPAPAFGGFDPNAGAQFGAGFRAGNTSGFFGLTAGQGANSTMVSQTPNITIPNGGNGIFIDGSFRPFVTGIVPVVGQKFDTDPSPLRERLRRMKSGEELAAASPGETSAAAAPAGNAAGGSGGGNGGASTADRGALSVAALKAQAAAEDKAAAEELAVLLEKAQGAEDTGKPNIARIYLQMAARRAQGEQQREILARIQALPK